MSAQIEAIWAEVKASRIALVRSFWYRFYWDEGDYSEVIQYFEEVEGILFGAPTGPDDERFTDFLVNIEVMYK